MLHLEKSTNGTPHPRKDGAAPIPPEQKAAQPTGDEGAYAIKTVGLNVYYGPFLAVRDVSLIIERNKITSLIGPSGCGKSSVLRSMNRMNDLIANARVEGEIFFNGQNIYAENVDPVLVRRHIGMVFQKPNPFPKSIYDNIAWGAKINGFRGDMDELVEESLRATALWDEVKGKLHQNALGLSGGQQQRLCIARTIAVKPNIILMDEPCSSLDPIATLKIEDLMHDLVANYTIIIVTHNMQQAARVSDCTAFFAVDRNRSGHLMEVGPTKEIFKRPKNKETEDYITGRFG